jgi:hypothetical protein
MQKVDLSKVLDLLIAEDREEASNLLHEWFVGKSKSILEDLMQEDDSALDGIESDKNEIESEEYYGDADLEEGDDDDTDFDMVGAETDLDGEEGDVDADASADLDDEMEVEEVPVEDKVDDLEAQLAELKAEFDKLMGVEEVEHGTDIDGDGDVEGVDGDDFGDDLDIEETVAPGVPGKKTTFVQKSGINKDGNKSIRESDDEDFEDLEESFELTKVSDPDMSEGSEAGNGKKQTVSKESPIPQRKTEDRVGGAVVEIKGKTHKGYEREASPGVNTKPILKNQVSNAKQDLTDVKPEGDKSALLNKAPVADKGKSPIGGGAVDLRGSDMKRKK